MIDKVEGGGEVKPQGCIYFRCPDIALTVKGLEKRGLSFTNKPHLIAKMDDHDLYMAFFTDPDGHTLALMQESTEGVQASGMTVSRHVCFWHGTGVLPTGTPCPRTELHCLCSSRWGTPGKLTQGNI